MAQNYIFSSELISLTLALFLLFLMVYTRPKITYVYAIDLFGTIFSIFAIIMEFVICIIASYPATFFQKRFFDLFCLIFYILYLCVLFLIVLYIDLLVAQKRGKKRYIFLVTSLLVFVIYIGGAIYLLSTNQLYSYDGTVLHFTLFVPYYISFGLLGAFVSLFVSIYNHTRLSKTVYTYILMFIPLDILLLFVQLLRPEFIFSGVTYVFPYLIFYILFHSNPYDDITGAQNEFAFLSRFQEYVRKKKKFLCIFISIPQLLNVDFFNYVGNETRVKQSYAETCRKIEYLYPGIHVYRLSTHTFALFFKTKDDNRASTIIEQVKNIMDDACKLVSSSNITYKMVVLHQHKNIQTHQMLQSFSYYLYDKIGTLPGSQCYTATEEDYQRYEEQYQIEQVLLEIRNNLNLDDERVLCYVQPIYSVADQKFHTCEALMRLRINGKMIFPDKFIPLAERNNCIHALTCIMLNKVCKQMAFLQHKYDLHAITVNCSSAELSNDFLHEEILQIIDQNHIPNSAIRIELTESAMFDDFDIVKKNLKVLNNEGVLFYLDDFGTGYSNLERIITCPFYTIKFDKSLLYKAIDDISMKELITEMIQVFKKKDFHALVEGVENQEQLDFAIAHGFEFIQGYHFSKPIPIEDLPAFLESH